MTDNQNKFRTLSLFWETRSDRTDAPVGPPPLFTLKAFPHTVKGVTYPSLKQIYFSFDHIPGYEYEFALAVFNSWDHWLKLTKDSSVRNVFQEWREELAIKLKCQAIKKLLAVSSQETAIGINAARYLADEGYIPKKVGRMSKEEKARQLKLDAGIRENLHSDMERLGLSVVK